MNNKFNSTNRVFQLLENGRPLENKPKNAGSDAASKRTVDYPNGASPTMRLVPGYDSRTRRMEMGAFFFLASTALTLIALAAANAIQFSQNLDGIAAALSSGGVVETARSGTRNPNHILTNVTVVPALPHGAPGGVNQAASHQS